MAEPVITAAMITLFREVYAETELAIANSVSAETMDAATEATAAGLRAAIAQYLAEQDDRHNGCCSMGICQYDRDCPGYANCTLGPVEVDRG